MEFVFFFACGFSKKFNKFRKFIQFAEYSQIFFIVKMLSNYFLIPTSLSLIPITSLQ